MRGRFLPSFRMRYPIVGLIAVFFVALSWGFVRNSADDQAAAQGPASPMLKAVGPDRPIVPGFERFYADEKSDTARGGRGLAEGKNVGQLTGKSLAPGW